VMSEVGPLDSRMSQASTRSLARVVARARRLRSGMLTPWVLPGAARFYEARWAWMLRRAPIVTGAEHAARTGLKDIEEIVACDLCGQTRCQPLFHPKRRRQHYHVVRCPDCGFLYRQQGIKPERLGELYSSGRYGKFLTGKYSGKRQRRYRLVMDAFSPLLSDGAGRRLLDFGCGAGLFLEVAHKRGFDCYGVDLSQDAVDLAREHLWGANAYHGAPLDVPEIAAGGFDVITLWSVLAHLATPVEDFRMLRSLLAPDGVLLVLTVNANSLFLKARREDWNGFTPNHLKFFSPTTLSRLLAKAGFAAVTMPPMPPDSVTTGRADLSARQLRRLHRTTERGNTGNMLRAVAYNLADTPARYGITHHTRLLDTQASVLSPAAS
jgi:2-polyprenyl-3-methyl-5-hydroxy-6-metoxy-1,4-benzoquinol methylase